MILGDFLKALRQMTDRPFRRVLLIGVLLSLALLIAVNALALIAKPRMVATVPK